MRVAKATRTDIDASFELLGLLDSISKRYYPTADDGQTDTPVFIDEHDPEHLAHVWRLLCKIIDKAPGFQGRVIFGFATLADPRNKILNPDLDHIELHPRFAYTPASVLKGIGKINGDGWKDKTVIGEIVYVWNTELPNPYKPGQYPRIGYPAWSASTDQYNFEPLAPAVAAQAVEEMFARALADLHRAMAANNPAAAEGAPT